MQSDISWDDLRLVLAIARAETLAGAARALGVHHATVYRRLHACEQALGVTLFDRDRGRHLPTAAGEEWVAIADDMDSSVVEAARRSAGRDLMPAGTLGLTTTDTLWQGLLSPMLAVFREDFPDICLDVQVLNDPLDLARRDADIAIRAAQEAPDPLIAHELGRIVMARYRSLTRTSAAPSWLGLSKAVPYPAFHRWMAAHVADSDCVLRTDSMLAMQRAAVDGMGDAVLPCYLADSDRALVRIGAPILSLTTPAWLLIHPDMRRTARVRALRQALIAAFDAPDVRDRLAGRSAN